MNVIALDTASPIPAVVVLRREALFEERLSRERRASEDLLPALSGCLEAAGVALSDCDRIAVCSGPGSFTGVRIGLATAWGLRRALGIPLESVTTLEAMAEAARQAAGETVVTALDAGRGEIVLARFALEEDRARQIAPAVRLAAGEAAAAARGAELFCLPPELLAGAEILPQSPCAALALAVARSPRSPGREAPEAIYSRPSAAEENRGGS